MVLLVIVVFWIFIAIPKPPLSAVVIVPRGFCPKMRPC
ncbi:rfbP protein [Vibrio mimicus]|nr:rfbP protein [Vibrio mimicus]